MKQTKSASLPLFAPEVDELARLRQRQAKTSPRFPLVGPTWFKGVDIAAPSPRNPGCMACALHATARNVCLDGLGDPGGVLLVSSTPTRNEDLSGEPSRGGQNIELLSLVGKHYKGPWRLVYAVACAGGRIAPPADKKLHKTWVNPIEACRPYLTAEIDKGYERIVALGDVAARALTGLRIDPLGVRRGWGEVRGIPTFFTLHPGVAFHNRFVADWFREDLKWALTATPLPRPKGEVRVLLTPLEVRAFLAELTRDIVIVDIEHEGHLWDDRFRLLCISMCQDPEAPIVIPADVAFSTKDDLKKWLEDPTRWKGGQAIKHDRQGIFRALGIDLAGVHSDTLAQAHQRESDAPASLGAQAWVVGMGGYKGEAHDQAEDDAEGMNFGKVEPDILHQYAARDVSVNLLVHRWQKPRVAKYLPTWEGLLRPTLWALGHVERWGATLSSDNVKAYDRWLVEHLTTIEAKIRAHEKVPDGINLGASAQVSKLLFEIIGLRPNPKWKNSQGYSVDKETLKALEGKHPLIPLLQAANNYRTQRKNYGLKMIEEIGYDGKVHTTYKIVRSGRLSSSDPNMQNISSPGVKPGEKDYDLLSPDDEGIWARGCWVAPPGHVLVNLDYAQQELRIAAMLSGDEDMAAAFEAGHDFHTMTAAEAFEISPGDVNAEQRRVAKVINFALVFGMDEFGIAKGANITVARASSLLDSLLGKYKKLAAWRRGEVSKAERLGESVGLWAPSPHINWVCRRNIWQIGELGDGKDADGHRKHAKNQALNHPIQNVANCFSMASLHAAVQWIKDENIPARLTITVHDSLVLEVPESMALDVARQVQAIMVSWPSGIVKLKADIEVGPDWGTLRKVKL